MGLIKNLHETCNNSIIVFNMKKKNIKYARLYYDRLQLFWDASNGKPRSWEHDWLTTTRHEICSQIRSKKEIVQNGETKIWRLNVSKPLGP